MTPPTYPVATRLPMDEALLVELKAERAGETVAGWLRSLIRERLAREPGEKHALVSRQESPR